MTALPLADAAGRREACGADPTTTCRNVYELFDSVAAARTADLLARPLRIIVVLLLALIVHRLVRRALRRFTGRLTTGPMAGLRAAARAKTVSDVLGSVAGALIGGIALLTVLGQIGVNLGPLLAGAGVAGVAFGFGAQTLVKDFLTGLFMLIEDQYGVGDTIDVGAASGTVEAVGLRTTRLRDLDGVVWHVPNGEIRRVGNKSQQWARVLVDIDVAHDADVDEAIAVLERVAIDLWHDDAWVDRVLDEPAVWAIERISPDAATLRVVGRSVPGEQAAVARDLRRRARAALAAAGIALPVPLAGGAAARRQPRRADRRPPPSGRAR